jgi:hypothetical protein
MVVDREFAMLVNCKQKFEVQSRGMMLKHLTISAKEPFEVVVTFWHMNRLWLSMQIGKFCTCAPFSGGVNF